MFAPTPPTKRIEERRRGSWLTPPTSALIVTAVALGTLATSGHLRLASAAGLRDTAAVAATIREVPSPSTSLPATAPSARYIVQLAGTPLAAALPGIVAPRHVGYRPAPGFPPQRSGRARALELEQAAFLARMQRIAPSVRPQHRYSLAFNGFAFRLNVTQAAQVRALPGVKAVTAAERVRPLMDASLPLIGAPAAWANPLVGGASGAGRGTRIAVIDSGISAAHPLFADEGFVAPEGFPRAAAHVGDVTWDYEAEQAALYTNAKVIAARVYANPELVTAGVDPRTLLSPLADNPLALPVPLPLPNPGFHGAHVAATAAGVGVSAAPGDPGTGSLALSGVAPGAQVLAYKFNDAYTPEILAMIEDALRDGADVINNSWGTSLMNIVPAAPHPVAQAFGVAREAGVVVVAAAGNAGVNGEATLGGPHQMSEDVITVANSATGRSFAYVLTARDDELPPELEVHPTRYEAFDRSFEVIDRRALFTDLCDPVQLLLDAPGRIALARMDTACEESVLGLPLPGAVAFVEKMVVAALVGAEAVVFYQPDGDLDAMSASLSVLELLAPLIEGALGQIQLPIPGLGEDLSFPVTAVIAGPQAVALAEFADGRSTMRLRLDPTPRSEIDPDAVDAIHPTSARGPVPLAAGVSGPLKPDLAAPGTDILSANTNDDGSPAGYTLATGTSMAAPQVSGAAAVLRGARPDWSVDAIHSALVITADPVAHRDGALAPATVQGAGRLRLDRALEPGALLLPPSRELGRHAADTVTVTTRIRVLDARQAAEGNTTWTVRHEPGVAPAPLAPALPAALSVPEGGEALLDPIWMLEGLPAGSYDGRIVLDDGTRTVRFTWHLRITEPARDVLLLSVRRQRSGGGAIPGLPGGGGLSDGPDVAGYWTDALDTLGLRYDVWHVADGQQAGTPPLSTLQRYRLVLLAAGDGDAPLDALPGGMTALQMYLLGGGRLLASGWNLPHTLNASLDLQNSGSMHILPRYFAGFDRIADDVAPEGDLLPSRLFEAPVHLATEAGPDAAGNGGVLDFGRPLASVTTAAAGNQAPPDLGISAPLVAEHAIRRARPMIEIDGQGAAMIEVAGDARLSAPRRDPAVPWRALFAGFGLEAVTPVDGGISRAQLLGDVWRWATESDDVTVRVEGPARAEADEWIEFRAESTVPAGVEIVGWRWDAGDGRPVIVTTEPRLRLRYAAQGARTVRVEVTTGAAHSHVGETNVRIIGGPVYLPWSVGAGGS